MSKTYFNAFNESEFYCITFRFYCHHAGGGVSSGGSMCVKMHSSQNVDKIVKTVHGMRTGGHHSRKTGDKAKTKHSFSITKAT